MDEPMIMYPSWFDRADAVDDFKLGDSNRLLTSVSFAFVYHQYTSDGGLFQALVPDYEGVTDVLAALQRNHALQPAHRRLFNCGLLVDQAPLFTHRTTVADLNAEIERVHSAHCQRLGQTSDSAGAAASHIRC